MKKRNNMVASCSTITLKALFLSRHLKFCLVLLAMYKNGLIRKIMLNSKFMTSRPGKQRIAIHKNVVDKLFLEPYLKNQNWSYLRINSLKFYTLCLYCIPSWGPSKYIETKLQATSLHLIYTTCLKGRSGTSLPASFFALVLKKNVLIINFH